MPEAQRTLDEVKAAAHGLEEAIISLDAIAQHPQTPYPKHDVEQRANMARNTMRKQLERSIQAQKEYEDKNAEKLKAAKDARETELKRREETRAAAGKAEQDRKQKIAEERQKIAEKDRELAELRAEEDKAREAAELTTDSETGGKVKRHKKPRGCASGKRKKKNGDGEDSGEESGAEPKRRNRRNRSGGDSDSEKPKKKQRLARKSAGKPNKYKSSEIVVESDESERDEPHVEAKELMDVEDEETFAVPTKRKSRRAMVDSDEDEDEEAAPAREDSPATANRDGDIPMADSGNNEDSE